LLALRALGFASSIRYRKFNVKAAARTFAFKEGAGHRATLPAPKLLYNRQIPLPGMRRLTQDKLFEGGWYVDRV
jgi:hypothetical protein